MFLLHTFINTILSCTILFHLIFNYVTLLLPPDYLSLFYLPHCPYPPFSYPSSIPLIFFSLFSSFFPFSEDDDEERPTGYPTSSLYIPPYSPLTRSVSSMTAHSTAIPSLDPVSELDGIPDSSGIPATSDAPSPEVTDRITLRRSGSDGMSAGIYSSHNSPNIYRKHSASIGADDPMPTSQSTSDLTAFGQSRRQSTWSVIKKVHN